MHLTLIFYILFKGLKSKDFDIYISENLVKE